MPACLQVDVSRASKTICDRKFSISLPEVGDPYSFGYHLTKEIAKWRLAVKKAVQAWMDDDDYIQDLIVASEEVMAKKQYLRPQDQES